MGHAHRHGLARRAHPRLIEPVGGEVEYYRRFLPGDGSFGLAFHHFATFVPVGDDVWERLTALLAEHGLRFGYTVLIPTGCAPATST